MSEDNLKVRESRTIQFSKTKLFFIVLCFAILFFAIGYYVAAKAEVQRANMFIAQFIDENYCIPRGEEGYGSFEISAITPTE